MAVKIVIVNARVWTGDPRRPWADAVAIEGDRIEAVGSSAEIMKLAAGARVIDAKGAMVEAVEPGVLRAGILADLVMTERDVAPIAPTPVRNATVLLKIVGGRIVFERA